LNVKLISHNVKDLRSLTKEIVVDLESIIEKLKNHNKTK